MNATQEWRPIPGYEGCYEASPNGQVRSIDRIDQLGRLHPGMLRKPVEDAKGYHRMMLYKDGKRQLQLVHRLIAFTYCPGQADGLEVCHWDGNPGNNAAANLRWDTRSANHHDKIRHGTHSETRKTHCPRGHEYVGRNLHMRKGGGRKCRACMAARSWIKRNGGSEAEFLQRANAWLGAT